MATKSESESGKPRRKRIWVWLVIAGVVVALLAVNYAPLAGPSEFPVGPDTTVIEGPLNADGTVNYVAYLNERYSEGVTPENNAMVLLVRALGPEIYRPEAQARGFGLMGIPVPPAKGDYFVRWDKRLRAGDSAGRSQQLDTATGRPWTAGEFPPLAKWLEEFANHLGIAVEASRRPRLYLPIASPGDPERLVGATPFLFDLWQLGRALAARSMLRLGDGDVDAAWSDAIALFRLGRLLNGTPTLTGRLVGSSLEGRGATVAETLATDSRITRSLARRMVRDIETLRPPRPLAEAVDEGERFSQLDAMAVLWRGDGTGRMAQQVASVDWALWLREVNRAMDVVLAQAEDRPPPGGKSVGQLADEYKARSRPAIQVVARAGGRLTRRLRSRTGIALILSVSLLDLRDTVRRQAADLARTDLALVASAVAACRAEKGTYPETLSELEDAFLKVVPADRFNEGEPLVYRRTEDGYVLYSVFKDGTDNGGLPWRPGGTDKGVDLVISVPPAEPAAEK